MRLRDMREQVLKEMGFDGEFDLNYINNNPQYSARRDGVKKLGSARRRKFNKAGMGGAKNVDRGIKA